jgi:hypothetical protein
MRFFAATALLLLVLLPLPVGAQTFGEERRYFQDWLAACRPDGYCSATAYDNPNPPSGIVADHILRVGRHPEGLYWEVSISTVAEMADESAGFTIATDTETFGFSVPETAGAYAAINDFFFLGEDARGLIDAMVAGTGISVAFTDEAGSRQYADFSLSGLAATLLWIDERQGRVGSERVAFAPPVGLEPVGAAAHRLPPALLALHAESADCEPLSELPHGDDVIAAQMDDGVEVYFVPCTAGAYNFLFRGYQGSDGGHYRVIYFADFNYVMGWSGTDLLFNVDYEPDSRTLFAYYKGRGVGDCGTTGRWVWAGYAFRMLEYTAKADCDGEGYPGEFPVVYRAKPLASD